MKTFALRLIGVSCRMEEPRKRLDAEVHRDEDEAEHRRREAVLALAEHADEQDRGRHQPDPAEGGHADRCPSPGAGRRVAIASAAARSANARSACWTSQAPAAAA